jgi:ligand-binding SRPBCC domain-containing protein
MAKEYIFTDEQFVPASPEALFHFFSKPENLEKITHPDMGFQVLRSSTPVITQGTEIEYRLHQMGIPLKWKANIEEWVPNQYFVDVQASGPFHTYRHKHSLYPVPGGTKIVDELRYTLPLGFLGSLVAGTIISNQMKATFAYRKLRMLELFPGT